MGHLQSSNQHQIKGEGRGGGERGNLVKMLDDLGQRLTPEIMDWSAASTSFNDIKLKPFYMGFFSRDSSCTPASCLRFSDLRLFRHLRSQLSPTWIWKYLTEMHCKANQLSIFKTFCQSYVEDFFQIFSFSLIVIKSQKSCVEWFFSYAFLRWLAMEIQP